MCGGKGGGLCVHLDIAQLNVRRGRLRVEGDGESDKDGYTECDGCEESKGILESDQR